jgi:hypothetical protein
VPEGITLIVSPLRAIQRDQADSLASTSTSEFPFKPFVLDGESNTSINWRDIACGKYTHIWTSAVIIVGDYDGKKVRRQERRTKKRQTKTGPGHGYIDTGSFQDVLYHEQCWSILSLYATLKYSSI